MKLNYIYIILLTVATGCNRASGDKAILAGKARREPASSVTWMDTALNLGKINMGDTVVIRFRFKNTGKVPLIIQKVETGCSCTIATTKTGAIPPGGESFIRVMFDTRKSIVGFVGKAILVTSNTLPAKRVLFYGAEITGHKLLK
ncbi:MAG: DUF1573 domain-containing protein [Bacteroidota bacterium]